MIKKSYYCLQEVGILYSTNLETAATTKQVSTKANSVLKNNTGWFANTNSTTQSRISILALNFYFNITFTS